MNHFDRNKHCSCMGERKAVIRTNGRGEAREVCKKCKKPIFVEREIQFKKERVPA